MVMSWSILCPQQCSHQWRSAVIDHMHSYHIDVIWINDARFTARYKSPLIQVRNVAHCRVLQFLCILTKWEVLITIVAHK
mmetsp:Transcript_34102/g.63646  ORF Transcript_34102/g.63646 Transcript_34102/m.63646 type:complete len:80 (+) Transcript_34102:39-278(+)